MAMTHLGGPLRIGDATGKGNQKGILGVPTSPIYAYKITPTAIVATAAAAAQAVAAAGNLTLNGTLASSGVVTFDVPRAASVVSANAGDTTQTATFFGRDDYGVPLTQTVTLNGTTTVVTTKAFKTITRIAISAATAGNISAGNSDVFGMPYYAYDRGDFVGISWANATITTGTFVAGVTATATALTGDVRGTFTPPSASNGTNKLYAYIYIEDFDSNICYGVDQF